MNPITKDLEAECHGQPLGVEYKLQMDHLLQQMAQMKDQFNNLLNSKSNFHHPVTPKVTDPASQLMLKTAEITNNLSLVEKIAPILKSNSQEAFHN